MLTATSFRKTANTPTGRQEVEIVVWDDDTETGIAYLPDLTMVGISIPGRYYETTEALPNLTPYEDAVISSMRACIAAMDSDPYEVDRQYNDAHNLFGALIREWSEEFGLLYNSMLEIHRAKTPHRKGRFQTRSIEVGYTPFQYQRFVPNNVQPPIPSGAELLQRFDQLIATYRQKENAA